ncbi:MAG: hypothetical protein QM784_30165 [Polyangiaceae bacterium]
MKHLLPLYVAFVAIGCSAIGCSATGAAKLNSPVSGKVDGNVRDTNPDDLGQGSPSLTLGDMRLNSNACQGTDIRPEYGPLTAESFLNQLKAAGYNYKIEEAREDLIYVDVQTGSETSRFRVATLHNAPDAARHLHEALLQHGMGSWGVHRSNIAVLGPIGDVEGVVDFAVTSKLACWGVLTVAGRDDTFVVPGGYVEL